MASVKEAKAVDSTLGAIVAHPLRCRCLTIFSDRTASPNEIANELGAKLSDVAYHVRVLKESECIELVDTKPRRGANEHFYRATRRPLFSDQQFAELPPEQRLPFVRLALQLSLADAALSLEETTFVQRSDHHVSRLPVLVDEEGWRELRDIYSAAFEKAQEVQAAVAERRSQDPDAAVIPTRVVTMVFEMPGSGQQATRP